MAIRKSKDIQYISKDEIAIQDISDGTFNTNSDINEYIQDWDDGTTLTVYTKSRIVKIDRSVQLVEIKTKK